MHHIVQGIRFSTAASASMTTARVCLRSFLERSGEDIPDSIPSQMRIALLMCSSSVKHGPHLGTLDVNPGRRHLVSSLSISASL